MSALRTSRPPTCLFVEDDPSAREVGIAQLQALGLRVVAANDGTAALQELHRLKPDLLVTDLCMPGMDGITLTRLVKKMMPTLPVVACSAVYPTSSGEAREMVRAGAEGFLPKPMRAGELHSLIASIIPLPANSRPEAKPPTRPDGLTELPAVGQEFAYEQLVAAKTRTHRATIALVGAAGDSFLDVRVPKSLVGPGDPMVMELKGRILVGDRVEDLKGRVTVRIGSRSATNVRTEVFRAEVISATSVEAWEALREYLALRTPS